MSFSPGKSVNETSLGASSLFLNPPSPIGQVRIGTDGESYLNFGLSRLHQADGYEWTVTNANIISGNGTRSISVVPACLSTVTASVRAYNLNPDGTRCYTVPVTTSYYWTGDCLFNGIN
ncbi:MAG TPA: hypothetical protein DCR93_12730 [Cytophagales bacterium]|nr:hypothetical protein [Cytophagales bacterium]HAP60311.1 hypothetical protein [Cytophagales bacterium]